MHVPCEGNAPRMQGTTYPRHSTERIALRGYNEPRFHATPPNALPSADTRHYVSPPSDRTHVLSLSRVRLVLCSGRLRWLAVQLSKPRVRYRINHFAFTAAPMASNSASVEFVVWPRWQVTVLLWSSLFLDVEETFVEFIDCPSFYSVTLIWLQRWHSVKWDVKISMNDEWPRIVEEAIAPCVKVLRTFVFRNWWIDKDVWIVNRHSRRRSDPTNFRMLSIGVSFLDFSCVSAWSYMKFDIWVFFENLSRKFKFHLNRTKIKGTLYGDQYTFLIIYRSVILRMKTVSDISYRETRNTHFIVNHFFSENRAIMR
jgi:hypothetical protein